MQYFPGNPIAGPKFSVSPILAWPNHYFYRVLSLAVWAPRRLYCCRKPCRKLLYGHVRLCFTIFSLLAWLLYLFSWRFSVLYDKWKQHAAHIKWRQFTEWAWLCISTIVRRPIRSDFKRGGGVLVWPSRQPKIRGCGTQLPDADKIVIFQHSKYAWIKVSANNGTYNHTIFNA